MLEQPRRDMRRAPRYAGEFWVMVQGAEDEMTLRRGNISNTGIIFGTDELDLELGHLEYLHVASADRAFGVVVMAQVARLVALDGGPVGRPYRGIAFEFMPENDTRRTEIEQLVEHAAGHAEAVAPTPASTASPAPATGQVFALEIPHLRMQTTWPVEVGDRVQVVVRQGATGRIPFEGVVKSVVSPEPHVRPPRYEVEVASMQAGQRAGAHMHPTLTESIDIALAEIMYGEMSADLSHERPHLRGRLDRICLATVLGWFDVGRMSGRLRVQGPKDERATLYLREGSLVDVDGLAENTDPIEGLRQVLSWAEGRFELHECDVSRPDRVQTSMPALLLELARQADESHGALGFVA